MTDWYKVKRILTWVNWEEKQIYPAVFEYSIDFKNNSQANWVCIWIGCG